MAALSPAQADEASLWLVIFLAVLLAVSLAAVIMSPSQAGGRHAKEAGAEPGLPGPGHESAASALPRRVAGQSGVAYPAGDPARPAGVIWPLRASGGAPWGPVPKPPEVPVQVQYGGQVIDTGTGRIWRCPHNHATPESASRCADAMEERINRLGWEQATGGRP
ncbi:MAG TPA: hypothetical protein VH307_15635 [Streptosporangiaceae bacterium]|jgi:hypothetical protein|nr:hypothetical protein [Streptosporangiaceae bacterium]